MYLRLRDLVADGLQELDHFKDADVAVVVHVNGMKYLLNNMLM